MKQETILEQDIDIQHALTDAHMAILSSEALAFVGKLHKTFNTTRKALLARRQDIQQQIHGGFLPTFLPETANIRNGNWQASPVPIEIQDRRTEITGPIDRKMIINALNAGAKVFMADFEDSNSPTFLNCIEGQINLYDAIRRQIDFTAENGKRYALNPETAVLMVRPRGWHLEDKHILVEGEPISASILDFGLYFFHNAHALLEQGSAPYFYLPKMESHLEARLWNDIFRVAQDELQIPQGTIKATVLVETILAVFEMDEIIYELREHMAGLNAGRWDYLFSAIKKFAKHTDKIFPERSQLTMGVPFMEAYTKLLVQTCHKRGVHAMGGMAAFIPSRKDEEANRLAYEKVRLDKEREVKLGFDGTWVAHPDLVPIAREIFDRVLGASPNQKDEFRSQFYQVPPENLLNFSIDGGKITETGFRMNINVGILYIESWLMGTGAAAIYNLMEDAATAEISRAQLWQWIHAGVTLEDGRQVTKALYEQCLPEELDKIKAYVGEERYRAGKFELATELFNTLVFSPDFPEFLTLSAYQHI